MANRGTKRARKGSEDMSDAESVDLLPPVSHIQEMVGLFCELRREAAGNRFIGSWGFTAMVEHALSGLLARFRGAERLGRPYVAWELLEALDEEVFENGGISVLAITSVPKPTFFEEPIAGQAYDSLHEIQENGHMESLLRRILEWCETGRVTQPTLAELGASPEVPPAGLARVPTANMLEQGFPFVPRLPQFPTRHMPEVEFSYVPGIPRVSRELTAEPDFTFAPRFVPDLTDYTAEPDCTFAPRAPRVPTGYTPERELPPAPRRQAPTGVASPARTPSDAPVRDRAASPPPPAEPYTRRFKKGKYE